MSSVSCFICSSALKPPFIQCAHCFVCKQDQNSGVSNSGYADGGEINSICDDDNDNLPQDIVVRQSGVDSVKWSSSLLCLGETHLDSDTEESQLLPISICVTCFRLGKSLAPHQNNHSYTVIRDDMVVIPGSTWTAREELALLNAITSHGLGNWSSVARELNSRSAKDCERHYFQFYVSGQSYGMPVCRMEIPNEFSCFAPLKYTESQHPPRPHAMSGMYSKLCQYSAARGEFSVEYDNNAELLISDIQADTREELHHAAGDEDDTFYRELDLTVVKVYRQKILERERRKRIVKDYGLINPDSMEVYFRRLLMLKLLKSHHVDSLRRLMKLLKPETFIKYVELLKVELRLKQRIMKLCEFRSEGLTHLHQTVLYERLIHQRRETVGKRHFLSDVTKNIQDRETWEKWLVKNKISEKLATGHSIPHPTLSRKPSTPIDVTGMQGCEKLTADEKELCSVLRLKPTAFLNYKTIIINECTKEGFIKLARARILIKIDVNKTRKIYDFLINKQLISKDPL